MSNTMRKSNLESLRIFAMIMIIASHYVNLGILQNFASNLSWQNGNIIKKAYSFLLLTGGDIGVGIFFIITGYFKILTNKICLSKVFLTTVFYSLLSLILYFGLRLFTSYDFNPDNKVGFFLSYLLLPINSDTWWYVTVYVFLCLLQPVINEFLNKLNLKGLLFFILLYWSFYYTFANLLTHFGKCPYYPIQRGIMFYLLGGFIRKLEIADKIKFNKRCWYIFLSCISIALFAIQRWFKYELISSCNLPYKSYFDYFFSFIGQCILVPMSVITLFLLFKSFNFQNKYVNVVSSTTFGIYLLHVSPFIGSYLWQKILFVLDFQYQSNFYILFSVFSVFSFFSVCAGVDLFRSFLFEKFIFPLYEKFKKLCFVIFVEQKV